ncbi:MAG TPA: alpha/beta hydrolase [Clostridiales bacterium]|nr:alpha/beta hydrolase [Clostridiales bacterium]
MDTNYTFSSDGAKIAYSITGSGEPLLLVHGSGHSKELWLELGWIDAFQPHFTVIALDIRGNGGSDKSYDPDFYSINRILEDIQCVIKACGFHEFNYFAHSYGATIGLQALAHQLPVRKAVLASAMFGDRFFKKIVPAWIKEYGSFNDKKKAGELGNLKVSSEELDWIQSTDLDLWIAQFQAWKHWKGVSIDQIKSPLAIYSGTKDNKAVLINLENNKAVLENHKINTKVFDGLGHSELVTKRELCYPWVMENLI